MKFLYKTLFILISLFIITFAREKLYVVTTLSVYADITKQVAGDKVNVDYIVPGDQDAHFVRPKPSYAVKLNKADMFVTTGLDLELWVPSIVDMSKNSKIRSWLAWRRYYLYCKKAWLQYFGPYRHEQQPDSPGTGHRTQGSYCGPAR